MKYSEALPNEILSHIFSFLSPMCFFRLHLASKIIVESGFLHGSVAIFDCNRYSTYVKAKTRNRKPAQRIMLGVCDRLAKHCSYKLTKLVVDTTNLHNHESSLAALAVAASPTLRFFSFGGRWFDGLDWMNELRFPNLERLELSLEGDFYDCPELPILKGIFERGCPKLRHLCIESGMSMEEAKELFTYIGTFVENLETLDICANRLFEPEEGQPPEYRPFGPSGAEWIILALQKSKETLKKLSLSVAGRSAGDLLVEFFGDSAQLVDRDRCDFLEKKCRDMFGIGLHCLSVGTQSMFELLRSGAAVALPGVLDATFVKFLFEKFCSHQQKFHDEGLSFLLTIMMRSQGSISAELKGWWASQFEQSLETSLGRPSAYVDGETLRLISTYVQSIKKDQLNVVRRIKEWIANDHYALVRLAVVQDRQLSFQNTWRLMELLLKDREWIRSNGIDINMRDLFYDDPLAFHLPSTENLRDLERPVVLALISHEEFDERLRRAGRGFYSSKDGYS